MFTVSRTQPCPSPYILNPVESTCIRLATPVNSWDDAKAICEAEGEKLAVFTSKESVAWANDKESVAWMNDRASTGIHYEANYFYHHLINLVFTTHSETELLWCCATAGPQLLREDATVPLFLLYVSRGNHSVKSDSLEKLPAL